MLHTKDYTTKLLDMEHMEIENIEVSADRITMHVTMKRRVSVWPASGARHDSNPHYPEHTL